MTKKYKIEKCKKLLYKKKLTTEEKKWLIKQVFKLHKDYKLKIGKGAKDVLTGVTKFGTKCFFILRNDNTKIDISFYQCLQPLTKKGEVDKVLRHIVQYQIKEFRKQNNVPENYEVDHYGLEFKDIVKFFMIGKDYNNLYNKIIDKDNFTQTFKDEKIIIEFQKLHKSLAKLQALTKEEHKKKTYGNV